ncbi:MAG: hypothetical protein KF693_08545 [Nitrospira sp.]|nr:hypothetical protein [Nitrospira sp.]
MRVLKCGVWGYGTRQERGKLEAVVARAGRPRLVIVGYFVGNDLLDDYLYPQITVVDGRPARMVELVDVKRGGRKFLSEDEQQERHRKFLERKVAGEQKPSGFTNRTKDFFSYHSVLYDLFRQFRGSGSLRRMAARLGLVEPPSPLPLSPELAIFQPTAEAPWLEQAWKEHFANLRHLRSAVEAEGATMLVVMFPSNVQVDKYLRPQERDLQWEYPNQRLTEFFQQEHIAFLDLLPEFQRHVRLPGRLNWGSHNDLYWPHDSHPNVTGNRLAGLLVAEHLLQSSYNFLSEEGTRLSDVKKRLVELTQMPR